MVLKECVYTENHEWARRDGDMVVIGITDYAQHELGEIVFVELPQEGSSCSAGDAVATIESVKTVSDIFIPLSGTIASVNASLENSPEVINSDPHGDGWIFAVKPERIEDLDILLSPEAYEKLLEEAQ